VFCCPLSRGVVGWSSRLPVFPCTGVGGVGEVPLASERDSTLGSIESHFQCPNLNFVNEASIRLRLSMNYCVDH